MLSQSQAGLEALVWPVQGWPAGQSFLQVRGPARCRGRVFTQIVPDSPNGLSPQDTLTHTHTLSLSPPRHWQPCGCRSPSLMVPRVTPGAVSSVTPISLSVCSWRSWPCAPSTRWGGSGCAWPQEPAGAAQPGAPSMGLEPESREDSPSCALTLFLQELGGRTVTPRRESGHLSLRVPL